MVVDGDREDFLGRILADDVLVQDTLDFLRFGQLLVAGLARVLEFLPDDVLTEFDAFVADKD